MEILGKVTEAAQNFKEQRLSGLKPPREFFDHHQLSRPASMNEATSRITYNTRHFSGNYLLIVLVLALWALLTNPILLIVIFLFAGGFAAINKFGPDPVTVGNQVITQKTLYIALFVVGIPLLLIANPVSLFFWLIGSSAIIILAHAALMEPGPESAYSAVEQV